VISRSTVARARRASWFALRCVVIPCAVSAGTAVLVHTNLHTGDGRLAADSGSPESESQQIRERPTASHSRRDRRLEMDFADLGQRLSRLSQDVEGLRSLRDHAVPPALLERSEFAVVIPISDMESPAPTERVTDNGYIQSTRCVVADLSELGGQLRVTRVEADPLIGLPRRSWVALSDWEFDGGQLRVVAEQTTGRRHGSATDRPLHEATAIRAWIAVATRPR